MLFVPLWRIAYKNQYVTNPLGTSICYPIIEDISPKPFNVSIANDTYPMFILGHTPYVLLPVTVLMFWDRMELSMMAILGFILTSS